MWRNAQSRSTSLIAYIPTVWYSFFIKNPRGCLKPSMASCFVGRVAIQLCLTNKLSLSLTLNSWYLQYGCCISLVGGGPLNSVCSWKAQNPKLFVGYLWWPTCLLSTWALQQRCHSYHQGLCGTLIPSENLALECTPTHPARRKMVQQTSHEDSTTSIWVHFTLLPNWANFSIESSVARGAQQGACTLLR